MAQPVLSLLLQRRISRVLLGALVASLLYQAFPGRADSGLWQQTLRLVAGSSLLAIPLSLIAAWGGCRASSTRGRIPCWILLAALGVPIYAHVAGWDAGWAWSGGRPAVLPAGSFQAQPFGLRSAIWVQAMAAVPWCTLILAGGLSLVDRQGEEQLLLDRSPLWVAWHYTLPQLELALSTSFLWILTTALSEIVITDYFQVRTVGEELYLGFATEGNPRDVVRRIAPNLVLLTATVAWWLVRWIWHLPTTGPRTTSSAIRPTRPGHGMASWFLGVLPWCVALVVVAVPVIQLGQQGGLVHQRVAGVRETWWSGTELMGRLGTALRDIHRELALSLLLGQAVAVGCIATAGPLAWLAPRSRVLASGLALGLAATLAVPAPVVALELIAWLDAPDRPWLNYLYDETLVPLWLVHSLRCWPWTFMLLTVALRQIPTQLRESAQLDGVGQLRQYWVLALPNTLAQHLAAWLAVMALSLAELSATILLSPPGYQLFSAAFFSQLHYGTRYELAALCFALWLLALLLASLVGLNSRGRPMKPN